MAQSAPGPFQNGGFEATVAPNPYLTVARGSTAITGWTVGAGGVDHVRDYWQPASGSQSIDLNALSPGGISQTFATVAGRSYRVTFALAGNPDSPGVKTVRVQAAGTQQDFSLDTTGRSRSAMGWTTQSLDFVSTDAQATHTSPASRPGPMALRSTMCACSS